MELHDNLDVRKKVKTAFVLDTSFAIDLSAQMLWALEVEELMKSFESEIIIPNEVKNEYDDLRSSGLKDNFGLPILDSSLEDLFDEKKLSFYCKSIDSDLITRSNRFDEIDKEVYMETHRDPTPLTYTDLSVIQAMKDHSKVKEVVVATSDATLAAKLNRERDEGSLNVRVFRPTRSIDRDNFSGINLGLLCTGNVYWDLFNSNADNDKMQKYIAVARNIHIGDGSYFDIGFNVYCQKPFQRLPQMEGVYFIPVLKMSIKKNGGDLRVGVPNNLIFTKKEYSLYCHDLPTLIFTFHQEPLTPVQTVSLIKKTRRVRYPELYRKEVLSSLNKRSIDTARVEDSYVGYHDTASKLKLESLRKQISQ